MRVRAALVCTLLLSAACVEERALILGTSSFQVEIDAVLGSPENPLPFPAEPLDFDVTVTALSNRGGPHTGFNGPVALTVQPGRLRAASGGTAIVQLVDGVGQTRVAIDRVYGSTHVCAEDRLGRAPSHALGCSDRLHFAMPTVAQVQMTDDNTTSPMVGSFIDIGSGDLIVTGVFPEGFYATDLAAEPVPGRPGDFGSIFVFNFSYPDGVAVGDRLASVSGTVDVFVGSTQLVFPSWTHRPDAPRRLEDVPTPVEITEEMCAAPTSGVNVGLCGHFSDNLDMESLEAALVTLQRARTPTRWVDCDFDRDGNVANFDPRCNEGQVPPFLETHCAEIACNAECNQDLGCSELSSFRQYGQWSVALNEGAGPKINVITREGVPELDPLAPENRGILLDVTGNLRHSLPARPRWIVLARDGDDVTVHRPASD